MLIRGTLRVSLSIATRYQLSVSLPEIDLFTIQSQDMLVVQNLKEWY